MNRIGYHRLRVRIAAARKARGWLAKPADGSQSPRMARKARGWTRGTLESKAHLGRGAIRHYETGEWIPRIDTLARISYALDVPINWMIYGNHPPKADRELMRKLIRDEQEAGAEQ